MTRQAGIAVFDLDHTLSRSDSFLLYLLGFLARRPWRLVRCVHLPIVVVLFWVGRVNSAKLKESFLHAVFGGIAEAELSAWTQVFVDQFLRNQLRRAGLTTLEAHRQAGDKLILLTASPNCYVTELGRRLRLDDIICTRVEWKNRRLTGKLASPNMRGHEKVRAVQVIKIRYSNRPITAYADHQSDLAMLKLADHGVLVNGSRKTKEVALREGIRCCTWSDDAAHVGEACYEGKCDGLQGDQLP